MNHDIRTCVCRACCDARLEARVVTKELLAHIWKRITFS